MPSISVIQPVWRPGTLCQEVQVTRNPIYLKLRKKRVKPERKTCFAITNLIYALWLGFTAYVQTQKLPWSEY